MLERTKEHDRQMSRWHSMWQTDVATPPTLASMTKKQKERAGKATNLSEFNQSCWGEKEAAEETTKFN